MFTKMLVPRIVAQILTCLVTNNLALSTYPPDYGPKLCENDGKSFDFIVCGAGSAGSTVASRLSEEISFTVLLLERGQDPDDTGNTEIPIKWASNLKSNIDYQYKTEKDEYLFKGLQDEVAWIPSGKVSGGDSSINVGLYIRGHKEEFDQWEKEGCTDWDSETVLRYYLKAEDYDGRENYDWNIHHIGGPLPVTSYRAPDEAIPIFAKGLADLGLNEMDDLNSGQKIGFGYADSTSSQGLRWSTFKSYISLTTYRPNFSYARNVLVRKVIIDEKSKVAMGVEITAPNGKTCVVQARREVILSLGAIASPQVLMLSGIGPKDHLHEMRIPVLVDLPSVGQFYKDHVVFVGTVFSDRKYRSQDQVKMESMKLVNATYALVNEGISTMGLTELVAFLDTTGLSQFPDIELMFMRLSHQTLMQTWNKKNKLFNMFGFSETTADMFTKLNDRTDLLFVLVILLDVRSTGSIQLRSDNPQEYPKIHAQYLRHVEEIQAMLNAVKFVQKLGQTETFKDAGYELEPVPYAACSDFEMFSDEYWLCALQEITTQFFHPGCTVRMGSEMDTEAALTPRLKVKGVRNLRVIDASSMRNLVASNPNASIIMMAEKGADMIKEDNCQETDYTSHLYPNVED